MRMGEEGDRRGGETNWSECDPYFMRRQSDEMQDSVTSYLCLLA